jgi:hypothetical protein
MSSRASIRERQLDAVEIFEHKNNHQIKSNAAVREPSLEELHWMQRIVGQERWGGGFVHHQREFLDGRQWICPLAEELVYQKKSKNKSMNEK